MHPGTPAPPPAIYQVLPQMPPSPSPAMQFADLKQPQPMASPVVMQQPPQQYPGVPRGGLSTPASFPSSTTADGHAYPVCPGGAHAGIYSNAGTSRWPRRASESVVCADL
ncbi:hypothetical protein PG988_003368 [Apiospora saccharicola]